MTVEDKKNDFKNDFKNENREKKDKKEKREKKDKKEKKDKNENREKKDKKEKINTNKNIIRQFGNFFNSIFNFNRLKGAMYFNIHLYILFIIGFATLFTTSITILIALLVIVSMDALSIVVLHECPLTTMEKKYLGITSCEIRNEFLYNSGIMYTCDHDYDKQIELLINVWTLICAKCLAIIFLQMFYIKLFDISKIYI
jgi:hypothetical protein